MMGWAPRAHWQVLGQQIMMGPYDSGPGDETRLSMDQWGGYPVARDRLLSAIAQRAANRTIVLTGDIHSNWVNELRSDFSRPDRPVVAAEFVGTSIASGGDGSGTIGARMATQLAENSHIKWYENRRGYYTCAVDAQQWITTYRSVPYVSRPGAPIASVSQWRVGHGRPGIEAVTTPSSR